MTVVSVAYFKIYIHFIVSPQQTSTKTLPGRVAINIPILARVILRLVILQLGVNIARAGGVNNTRRDGCVTKPDKAISPGD